MDELLKDLDPNIFTPEVIENIKAIFDAAVVEKVAEIEKVAELYKQAQKECFEKDVAIVERKANAYKKALKQKYSKMLGESKKVYAEKMNKKIESIISTKINESVRANSKNIEQIVESAKTQASNVMLERLLKLTGASVASINESQEKKTKDLNIQLRNMSAKFKEVEKELNSMKQKSILESVKSKLPSSKQDAFNKLARQVKFVNESEYRKSLDELSKSVLTASMVKKNEGRLTESSKTVVNMYSNLI